MIEKAPKRWAGRFYEDFDVGDVFRSRIGRTITETDNIWFTTLTMNTNQLHFNSVFAERTRFGRPLVVSSLTLAIVLGLSVADTSENAVANLSWGQITMPNPVYAGDTVWAESEVVSLRESRSKPHIGIVGLRTRGVNQRAEVVMEFTRKFMIYKRDAPEVQDPFPHTEAQWTV
jgi:itaconyl-CoA hydratase